MELHAFTTQEVESKLYDIQSAIEALSFAVNGLRNNEQINDVELSGFEYIIRNLRANTGNLLNNLQPVCFQESGKVVVLFGEED